MTSKIITPSDAPAACPTSSGSESCPEKSTSAKLRPGDQLVAHRDETDEQTERRGNQKPVHNARSDEATVPSERINHPISAPAAPMTSAQPMVANVGGTPGGTDGSASEKVPRPVQLSKPTKTSAPMPEASKPGSATRLSAAPPIPATSMIRKAPSTGEPSSVLTAAKLRRRP